MAFAKYKIVLKRCLAFLSAFLVLLGGISPAFGSEVPEEVPEHDTLDAAVSPEMAGEAVEDYVLGGPEVFTEDFDDGGISVASIGPSDATFTFMAAPPMLLSSPSSSSAVNFSSTSGKLSANVIRLLDFPSSSNAYSVGQLTINSLGGKSAIAVRSGVTYPAGNYKLYGDLTSYLYFGANDMRTYVYPTSVRIYDALNGVTIGTFSLSNGSVSVPFTDLVIPDDTGAVLFEFYFSPGVYTVNFTNGRPLYFSLYCYFDDGLFLEPVKEEPYVPLLSSILDVVRSIYSSLGSSVSSQLEAIRSAIVAASSGDYTNLLNLIRGDISAMHSAITSGFSAVGNAVQSVKDTLTSSPQQDAAASEFKGEMQETLDKIDEANQTIEDNTNRPSAEQVMPPSMDTIIDSSDGAYASAMEGIGQFANLSWVTSLLLVSVTISLTGYVLFGKKG